MFGKNLKIDPELLKRCQSCAAKAGYRSAEEFIHHVLERACKDSEEGYRHGEEEVTLRLKVPDPESGKP